jgi:hypothetical protein
MVGLACALLAQVGCGQLDEGQAGDGVSEVKSELIRASSLIPVATQRKITYCLTGWSGGGKAFPNQSFHDLIQSTYQAGELPWENAADVVFTRVVDMNCGTSLSATEWNIVFDGTLPIGKAITNFPSATKPRFITIGPQNTTSSADYSFQATHELGHVLGFADDTSGTVTIMNNAVKLTSVLSTSDKTDVAAAYGIPWESLGRPNATLAGKPAISTWGSSHFDVFARATDNHLYTRSFDPSTGWSVWSGLNGSIAGDPAAVSWGPNRIDVFARGTGNDLQHIWFQDGMWHSWESLSPGGSLASSVGVSSWASGRLDVFSRNSSSQLVHKWFDAAGWHGLETLGPTNAIAGAPAATSWASGRIDIVARGVNNDVRHFFFDGNWSASWESLGNASISGDPGISSWGANRLDVFSTRNSNLFHATYDNGWAGGFPPAWVNQLGQHSTGPTATAFRGVTGRIDVVMLAGGLVEHAWRDPADGFFKQAFH